MATTEQRKAASEQRSSKAMAVAPHGRMSKTMPERWKQLRCFWPQTSDEAHGTQRRQQPEMIEKGLLQKKRLNGG